MSEVPIDDPYTLHEADSSEIKNLPSLEAAADQVFRQLGITDLPQPTTTEELQRSRSILVAGNPPVGFARVEEIDGLAHLEQLSVAPEHSGKGIGSALLEAACNRASEEGYVAMTLSTFRDIPWNAPFYARHGFEVLAELSPGLEALRQHEISLGLHKLGPRVIMKRPLTSR